MSKPQWPEDRVRRIVRVLVASTTMPLGFSVGEWIVTVGVVVVAFGPKDIPIIARGLGRLTGQAVGEKHFPLSCPT